MKEITLVDLLKAGVHFGHKSSRWNPKVKPFIYGHRNNIHIFDLEKTKEKLFDARDYAKEISSKGGTILFVGTKKQAKEVVKAAAENCGMPYVVERWLGGTFTNFRTVQKSMKKLERLEGLIESGEIEGYTKKERLLIEREIAKLKKLFSGLQNMKSLPDVVFVLSAHHDSIAVKEADIANIPVIAVVDSNADPVGVNYIIPGNDDSVQAIALYANILAEAINEGRRQMQAVTPSDVVSSEEVKEKNQKAEETVPTK